jgi:hypothetical protein
VKVKLVLISAIAFPLIALTPKPAAAFGFGDIAGIAENFSPFISSLTGFDISPYSGIVNATGLFFRGDYVGASAAVAGSLGDFGIPVPSQLKDASSLEAQVRFNPDSDTGGGMSGLQSSTQVDNIEIAADADSQAGLSAESQTRMVDSGEQTAKVVKTSAEFSAQCGKTKVSLKCLRTLNGQTVANSYLLAQNVSETKQVKLEAKKMNAVLNDLRKNNNKKDRVDRNDSERKTLGSASTAGFFAGSVGVSDQNNLDSSGGSAN